MANHDPTKYQIHPAYPLYLDEARGAIRRGSLEGDIVVETSDPAVYQLLRLCADSPRLVTDLACLLQEKSASVDEGSVSRVVDELATCGVLVDADEARKLEDPNDPLASQAGFLSLFGGIDQALKAQGAIGQCCVSVIGVGAVGSIAADLLVRAGVGKLVLIDHDRVESRNLNRQTLFGAADVGQLKVEAATRRLRAAAPACDLDAQARCVDSVESAIEVIADAQIVLCTADSPARQIRNWINRACVEARAALVFGGFVERMASVGPLIQPGVTPCWECVVRSIGDVGPLPVNSDRVAPAFGPLASVVAGVMVHDVLGHISGIYRAATLGATLMFESPSLTATRTTWARVAGCPGCDQPTT